MYLTSRFLSARTVLRSLVTLEASCTEVELSREEQWPRTESESRRDLTGEAEEAWSSEVTNCKIDSYTGDRNF